MILYLLVAVDYDWYTFREPVLMTISVAEVKEHLEGLQHEVDLHQMSWEDYYNDVPYQLNEDEKPHYLLIKKEITCPSCHSMRNLLKSKQPW